MEHEELCPLCGTLQEMDISAFQSDRPDDHNPDGRCIVIAYHCKSCGALARYEHIHNEAELLPMISHAN